MNNKFYDVLVAKEFESHQNGAPERRTTWNKVGKAWATKSGESLNMELFLVPSHRYVIKFSNKEAEQEVVNQQGGQNE